MTEQSSKSPAESKSAVKAWLKPCNLALLISWPITTILTLAVAWDSAGSHLTGTLVLVLHAGYVAILIWHLASSGPPISKLKEIRSSSFPRWKYGPWIPVAVIAVLLGMSAIPGFCDNEILLVMMIAALWLLVAWWRKIRWLPVVLGLAVAGVALIGGYPYMLHEFISQTAYVSLALFAVPMFIAGGMLVHHTGLGGAQLYAGRFAKGLAGFLWGCLLFVPLGLINAVDGMSGTDLSWITEWWMPFTLPLFSGIVEEVWYRLFLVSLCYFLLRPAFNKQPAIAVIGAMLFSAVIFGLGHGLDLDGLLVTGLLYGLPMAVVFARRDWEHAAGAHYMVNMIPALIVFLD